MKIKQNLDEQGSIEIKPGVYLSTYNYKKEELLKLGLGELVEELPSAPYILYTDNGHIEGIQDHKLALVYIIAKAV